MEDSKSKREARRRKILENSERRLQKITRCKLEENENIEEIIEANSSTNTIITTKKNIDDNTVFEEESQRSLERSQNETYKLLEDLNRAGHLSDSMMDGISRAKTVAPLLGNVPKRVPVDEKFWKKLGFKLTLLAIVVRAIHIFKLGYLFGETVVIPFALFMMTQLGSYQFDQHASGICGPILIFIGLSPTKTKNLLVCYNVVTSILVYFAIYFFSFVCAHLTFVMVFGL